MRPDRLERVFFGALLAATLVFAWVVVESYLAPVILAATFALMFGGAYQRLLRPLRSPTLAALAVVVLATAVIFAPLVFVGVRIVNEATALYSFIAGGGDVATSFNAFVHTNFPAGRLPRVTAYLDGAVQQGLTWLVQNITPIFSGIAQAFFTGFLSLIGLFYFLKDGGKLKRWIVSIVPLEPAYTEEIVGAVKATMESVIRGTLVVAVVQGIFIGLGFLLFGVPNPAFAGAVGALFALIPIVGTWFVVAGGIAYLLLAGNVAATLGFIVWSFVTGNAIGSILAPQLMHRGAKNIHPYIILLSVLGGMAAFGPVGFVTGPLIVALLFSLLDVYPKLVSRPTR